MHEAKKLVWTDESLEYVSEGNMDHEVVVDEDLDVLASLNYVSFFGLEKLEVKGPKWLI